MASGTVTKEYNVTNMTVPQTADLLLEPVYHGLCDDVGVP